MGEPAGRRFGRYELVRVLGSGGMGEVWAAVLHGPGGFRKPVALKLLRGVGAEEERRALIREARIGAMVSHPNLVAVHELGSEDGQLFVAMEVVVGASVAELAKVGPLPPALILDIAQQTCLGLAHLHDATVDGRPAGVVHRDIKPQNLLVDRTGVVKIADLGVARLQGEAFAGGTAGYMAPEQWEGREDARADLFSLGVMMLALLTRQRPLGTGSEARAAARDIEQRLADPQLLGPADRAVPGWGAVLARCLRRDPALRFGSALELHAALRELRPPPEPTTLLDLLARVRPDLGPALDTSRPTPGTDEPTRLVGRGNVARPPEPLVGRVDEQREVRELLRGEARLVTLAGPGGAGKTRLARDLAWPLARELDGGAWFCDLSRAVDEADVGRAVAGALSIPVPQGDAVEHLGRALNGRGRQLVVLDNLEQVVDAASAVIGRWSQAAPNTTFLVTTQVPTRLPGERVVHLGPMLEADAVELFRRRAARPLEPAELPLVRGLVRALDAQPLAIELAAGRTRVLGVAQLVERLSDRLKLLAGGGSSLPERHRSLRASLDASVELLPRWAVEALAQLSAFCGPMSLEAAEAVLDLADDPDAPWALDVLTLLAERSLLAFDASTQRFRLLATVRDYARTLGSPEARHRARARHAARFAAVAGPRALEALARADGPEPFAALVEALDDLEAAFRFAASERDGATALATFRACWEVLQQLGPYRRARELLAELEALPLEPHDEGARLLLAGVVRNVTGDPKGGIVAFRALRELAAATGDRAAEGRALGFLALAMDGAGRPEEAGAMLREALALAEEGKAEPKTRAILLGNYASVLHDLGDQAAAEGGYEEALQVHRQLGERWHEARIRGNLANVLREVGRLGEARAHLDRALAIHRRLGKRRSEAAALSSLGSVLRLAGEPDEARRCFEASLACSRELGNVRSEASTLGNLANLHASLGRLGAARATFVRSVEVHRAVGDRLGAALVEVNLARLDTIQGRWADARALLERGLREHGTALAKRRTSALLHLASLDRLEGAVDAARRRLSEAEELAGAGPDAIDVRLVKAELQATTGEPDAAEASLQGLTGETDPRTLATIHGLRARALLAKGDPLGALAAADAALHAHERTFDRRERAGALTLRADAALRAGAIDDARRALAEAEAPLREAEDLPSLVEWHTVRGALAEATGGQAAPWALAAVELCDRAGVPAASPLRAQPR